MSFYKHRYPSHWSWPSVVVHSVVMSNVYRLKCLSLQSYYYYQYELLLDWTFHWSSHWREAKMSNREEKGKSKILFSSFERRKRNRKFLFPSFERKKRNLKEYSQLPRGEQEMDFLFSSFKKRKRKWKQFLPFREEKEKF